MLSFSSIVFSRVERPFPNEEIAEHFGCQFHVNRIDLRLEFG